MNSTLQSIERDLAGVVELSDLAGPILDRLQRIVGASGSTLSSYDQPGRKPTTQGGPLERLMVEYPPDLLAEDPIYAWNLSTPAGLFVTTGEDFDFHSFSRSRPYIEFYRPRDIGFMCGVRPTGLRYGSQHMFGLMFCTPSLAQRFDSQALDKLRQLEAPLRSAARRIARFRALEQKNDMLAQLLERQQGAFVIWNADGRLVWSSALAQAQLEGPLARSDLGHAAALATRQLRRTDTTNGEALLGRPRQLRSGRGHPLLVEFSSIRSADRRPWLLAELKACPGANRGIAELTNSETRVLRLVARGLSNREISEQLRVSNETIKTHVKRILSKLGVRSRGKAASVACEQWGRANQGDR
jgi:DNA-binding CsgD family transcriptional regulator